MGEDGKGSYCRQLGLAFCLSLGLIMDLYILTSCNALQEDLQRPRSYDIYAPQLPAGWSEQSGLNLRGWYWDLQFVASASGPGSGPPQFRNESASGAVLRVELKKQESLVLRAFPQFEEVPVHFGKKLWRPAGTVLMWQERSDDENQDICRYSIPATWLDGFRAQVLSDLLRRGFDVRYLNVAKLDYYIKKRMQWRAGDFLLNPWNYDLEFLVAELGRLAIDWYDIRMRTMVPILGDLGMPPGRWQALNVIEAALDCRISCTPELAVGQHYFWELNSRSLWLMEVSPDGEILALDVSDVKLDNRP